MSSFIYSPLEFTNLCLNKIGLSLTNVADYSFAVPNLLSRMGEQDYLDIVLSHEIVIKLSVEWGLAQGYRSIVTLAIINNELNIAASVICTQESEISLTAAQFVAGLSGNWNNFYYRTDADLLNLMMLLS